MAQIAPPPTTGETPLASNPWTADQFGSPTQAQPGLFRGGSQQAFEYQAFNDFSSIFGRNPTQSELSMLAPSYSIGDPNMKNNAGGKAAIASYFTQMSNTPSNIAAQQQQQALDAYNKNPNQFNSQLNPMFQQYLGRAPTAAEQTHFGSLLASGQGDPYQIGQLLGQSQESQQFMTQNYQNQLAQNLQGTQASYYSKYIQPQLQETLAQQGQAPGGSAYANAFAQAAQQQNYGLQNYLAQFGAGQYGQSAQNQQAVYGQYLNNLYGLQNAGVGQRVGQQNWFQQQNQNLNNWNMQQQAYQNYLSQYGNRNNGLGQLVGGVAGGVLGGAVSGWSPQGMQIGSQLGSGIGSSFGGGQRSTYGGQGGGGYGY